MSRQTARLALDQFCGKPSLVAPIYAGQSTNIDEIVSSGMLADLRELSVANPKKEEARWQQRKQTMAAAYGFEYVSQAETKPFAFANGKAIIPIHGILINRFPHSWSFVTGYNFIRSQVEAAEDDPDVDGVIFDINSYGGTCAGCPETSDIIAAMTKPTLGVIDANCFSAAYMIGCRLDRLVITPSGECGSIGVVQMHMDVSGALDKAGVKISFQFAGAHKTDGNSYEPLSKAAIKERQDKIDALYDMFVSKVVDGRPMKDAAVRGTEARCYSAENALSLKLVDAIQTPDDAVSAFFLGADDDDLDTGDGDDIELTVTPSEDDMAAAATTTTTVPAVVSGPTASEVEASNQAARTSERTRVKGIQTHAEAKDRPALAAHLSMETSMTVEEAGAILAAAAKETAPVAAVPVPVAAPVSETVTAAKPAVGNFFATAMDNTPNPNVGSGGSTAVAGGEDVVMTPAQRILETQRRAGGAVRPRAA